MLGWLAVSALSLVAICINGQISLPESSRPPEAPHRPDRPDPSNRDQPESPDLPHIPDLPHLPDLPDLPGPRYPIYQVHHIEKSNQSHRIYHFHNIYQIQQLLRVIQIDHVHQIEQMHHLHLMEMMDLIYLMGHEEKDPEKQSCWMWVDSMADYHVADDVIKWKHFPRYWPFVRGIHRWPVDSPHKGQWRGALMCALINGWTNCGFGDLRRHGVLVTSLWWEPVQPLTTILSNVGYCMVVKTKWYLEKNGPWECCIKQYISVINRKLCLVMWLLCLKTRDNEAIMFSPFVCVCVCVCPAVGPDSLTMKGWCHTIFGRNKGGEA